MNPSPLKTLVMLSGIKAVLSTPAVGSSTDYDPTATADFEPSLPQTKTVRGIYSDGRQQGLEEKWSGVFTITANSRPDWLQAQKSNLLLMGRSRQVDQIRERFHLGKIDGYDLRLTG